MTKEQTRELLDDYINFHVKKGIDKKTEARLRETAREYVSGVIETPRVVDLKCFTNYGDNTTGNYIEVRNPATPEEEEIGEALSLDHNNSQFGVNRLKLGSYYKFTINSWEVEFEDKPFLHIPEDTDTSRTLVTNANVLVDESHG